jgi:hypothetical protein
MELTKRVVTVGFETVFDSSSSSSFHSRPKRECEQLELIVAEPAGVNVQSLGWSDVAAAVDRLTNGWLIVAGYGGRKALTSQSNSHRVHVSNPGVVCRAASPE